MKFLFHQQRLKVTGAGLSNKTFSTSKFIFDFGYEPNQTRFHKASVPTICLCLYSV